MKVGGISISLFIMLAAVSAIAQAETPPSFYAGKQVSINVGTPPGSPASLYAQLVARHMSVHMPGHPAFIVKHLPGAGGLVAANTAWSKMAADGTALVSTNSLIFIEPLLGVGGGQFEARKFTWIGGTHVERMVCVTWHTSAIKTFKDAIEKPSIIGSYGAEGPSAVFARTANMFAGAKFQIIAGYSGGSEALIAMQRGEVDGNCAMGWHELTLRNEAWLREKQVNLLFQMGIEKEPEMAQVPALIDYARTPLDRRALELLLTPLEIGRPIYAPPGVPADRAMALREALERTLRDPTVLDEAKKAGLPLQHVPAAKIEKLLADVYSAPREVLMRARTAQE